MHNHNNDSDFIIIVLFIKSCQLSGVPIAVAVVVSIELLTNRIKTKNEQPYEHKAKKKPN